MVFKIYLTQQIAVNEDYVVTCGNCRGVGQGGARRTPDSRLPLGTFFRQGVAGAPGGAASYSLQAKSVEDARTFQPFRRLTRKTRSGTARKIPDDSRFLALPHGSERKISKLADIMAL
ncbi:hypothetical protein AOLI_G00190420 [Acnodon oligacanthus]